MKNSIKLLLSFTRKAYVGERVLPISKLTFDKIRKSLPKIIFLCFDRVSGFQGRLVIANNFIQFVMKMNRNHGSTFTIKWLKACSVALQKGLGDDKLNSLREIEPNLPLPRLINGCPAIINRSDRFLMKHGDARIIRFGHSLFSIYRVLSIPGKLKLETITEPFKGDLTFLKLLEKEAIEFKGPKFCDVSKLNLAPTTFHITGKASPSNVNSSFGILADVYHLLAHEKGGDVGFNILRYLSVVGTRGNTQKFLNRLDDAKNIIVMLPEESLPVKTSMISPFGQFATKHEAAGKIRVFALVDSVTQSVMKPLHLAIFDLLRRLPNDGTFDQDAAVLRCSEKAIRYNQAFSFDLSAATDRLPVTLTGQIFEGLFRLSGLGQAGVDVMVKRDFTFTTKSAELYKLDSSKSYRYAVGQPMGCLSSGAGLAITHHGVMQFASKSIGCKTDGEERYEILGDDIVIFDKALADSYTDVMKYLGLEINFSKSLISPNKPVFEFAKRTVIGDQLVSGISLSQIGSSNLRSSLINNVHQGISKGYISRNSSVQFCLNQFKQNAKKDLKLFAAVFHLSSQSKIERDILMSSIVDPAKGVYFDLETSFEVPVKTLIGMCIDKIQKRESSVELPRLETRQEGYEENEELFVASILHQALADIKVLGTNYQDTLKEGSMKLVKVSMLTDYHKSVITGGFADLVVDEYIKDTDPYELEDRVEKLAIKQAKVRNISMEEAFKVYHEVQVLSFKYKIPDRITASQEEGIASKNLKFFLNPLLMRGPRYGEQKSPQI